MAELREAFEQLGFESVTTYIQSGNVLFRTKEPAKSLTLKIENFLSKKFRYQSSVVVISLQQLEKIIEQAPKGFGQKADSYRYDVIFIKKPTTVKEVLKIIEIKEGVDQVFSGSTAIYFSRLIKKTAQSRLSRVVQQPLYQQMTIRNWNTTTKLAKKAHHLAD